MTDDEQAHELLLRLAGRLPGTLLWRLREWLAAGGHSSVAAVLPREVRVHKPAPVANRWRQL